MVFPPLVPVKRRRVIYVAAGPAPSMTRAGSSRCAPARDGLGSAPRTPGLLQAGDNKGWKTVNWLYWGLAAFLAAGSLALVLAPLWRRPAAPARRAAYDMQVLKDQLREIATVKMPDLNAASIETAMSMIAGTARSMGVTVAE